MASGPTPSPRSLGCTTRTWDATRAAIVTASSYTARCTNKRVGALHDCPVLLKHLRTARSMVSCSGASANTRLGDLPPSSCTTRLTVSAATLATDTPAAVEPVNDTKSTFGSAHSAEPTTGPSPYSRLNTPGG